MAREAWRAATMIGGLFIYNHKGEVLISRVYRDDIGWVLGVKFVLSVLAVSFQCRKRDLVLVFGVSWRCVLKINLWKIIYILKEEHHVRPWRPWQSDLSDYRLFPELFISGYQLYCSRWHRKEHRKCRSYIYFWFSCFSISLFFHEHRLADIFINTVLGDHLYLFCVWIPNMS